MWCDVTFSAMSFGRLPLGRHNVCPTALVPTVYGRPIMFGQHGYDFIIRSTADGLLSSFLC